MPSAVGYQPTFHREMGRCKNVSHLQTKGLLHLKAVYVPADDLTDPAGYNFAHLDATTLSRKIAELGLSCGGSIGFNLKILTLDS
jgi:F0F1-type ATP synthase beta subunit